MEFVLIWIVCGIVGAMIASSRGGSGPGGFFLGLLLGPLGVIITLFMGGEKEMAAKQLAAGEKKKCPRCAELVQPDALICKHCSHEFEVTA